jgi:hypothetical protein
LNIHPNDLISKPRIVAFKIRWNAVLPRRPARVGGCCCLHSGQQDVCRSSGREFQISQSVTYGAMKGKLEFGTEMRYTHDTKIVCVGTRRERFIVGGVFAVGAFLILAVVLRAVQIERGSRLLPSLSRMERSSFFRV